MTLKENLAVLEARLPELKERRDTGCFENDVYEAVDYWCDLGRRAVGNDTRLNYPARVRGETDLLTKLREILSHRGEQDAGQYQPLLNTAEAFLQQLEQVPLPCDGHLGVLRVVREQFRWLFDQYGFTIKEEEPTGACLASGRVSIELKWATASSLSFALTNDNTRHFWLEDLLYLHRDSRYSTVPNSLSLRTGEDVESWFRFVSSVLQQYGPELLTDQAGSWERLSQAQSQRDAEYAAMMNAKYGQK